eukprot:605881-Pleurochrysis_carterae.AAC.5
MLPDACRRRAPHTTSTYSAKCAKPTVPMHAHKNSATAARASLGLSLRQAPTLQERVSVSRARHARRHAQAHTPPTLARA